MREAEAEARQQNIDVAKFVRVQERATDRIRQAIAGREAIVAGSTFLVFIPF